MADEPRIVIFAKAPVAGLAKTRLIPALGAQRAARLAAKMLNHAVEQALASEVGPVELCVTPAPQDPMWAGRLPRHAALTFSDQGDGDLGERMARAARRTLEAGRPVLLMGTDCPALTAERLRSASEALMTSDAVMIPATDGGYVLLGLRRFAVSLFHDIAWSTEHVAAATRDRLCALGWPLNEKAPLHDIDEPDDLRWLPTDWDGVSRV
ncbi:MAG: TIGR04282 family arsenosugar biosynthesis glycosyltransferase [Hydrogenophaga sp.]|uniref:TIGR04282 family arsenosugar biosynthesis glycosyltransferase n=1 Tax=Hydrogenophaga sp. TaxID=1904254 RepID=UPI003D0AF09D